MSLYEIQQHIADAGTDVEEAIGHLDKAKSLLETATATVRMAGDGSVHGEPDDAARAAASAVTNADQARERAQAAIREANEYAAWA
jgi:hypothetical protein